MKPPLLGKLTAVGAALLLSFSANAATVNFNVDDYSAGTDVTNAVAGVTMGRYIHTSQSPTIDLSPGLSISTNGTRQYINPGMGGMRYFDHLYFGDLLTWSWAFDGIVLEFEQELQSINLEGFSSNGHPLFYAAFGQNGQILDYQQWTPGGPSSDYSLACGLEGPCVDQLFHLDFGEGVHQLRLSSSDSIVYLTSFSAQTIPIPTTAWLFGSALAGLLAAKKRNSQPLPQC
ncbi:hypothetical protein N9N07_03915 [Pseudomonadales bacterium]|nr:hypothetical protein [Pseudomonadales bacterium]